LKHEYYYYLL